MSSIVRLDGSLMVINRASACQVLHVLRLIKLTRLMKVPCPKKYHAWKKIFPRMNSASYTQNTAWCHVCKNAVVIEGYCIYAVTSILLAEKFRFLWS